MGLCRVDRSWLGFKGVAGVTTAPALAGTEVRRGQVRGFRARLGAGMGAFARWGNREPNTRTGASRRALERGGRRQWRRGALASMAKYGTGHGGDQEMDEKRQELTVNSTVQSAGRLVAR